MSCVPRLWFDVEDLFDFADNNARPTGIQRVCYEIYRAALADPTMRGRVGFVRHAAGERGLVEADWHALTSRFQRVTDRPPEAFHEPPSPQAASADTPPGAATASRRAGFLDSRARGVARRFGRILPAHIVRPGFLFAVMQAQAGLALSDALRLTVSHRLERAARRSAERARRGVRRVLAKGDGSDHPGSPPERAKPRRLSEIAERGDVLVVLGSPWFEQDYAELAGYARGRLGLRLAVLMHDAIPVRRPEWVDRGTVRVYRNWYRTVLPLADLVLSNSRATADDVERWCAEDRIRLRRAVQPLPIGSGFGPGLSGEGGRAPLPPALQRRLGLRPFVLFVSTIEARKNHLLLFRAWRRLMDEMGADQVPELVFAGRVGWLVNDLMDQIQNSRSLDGRLHVIQGLDDASLRALYDNCLFTVFPSFYEGWGLPVSESLSLGVPCICSNSTSLPEAGGELARYFDPFNLNDAVRVIRDAIKDPAGLSDWRERVVRQYQPVGWDRTAQALLEAVDRTG